MATTSGAAAAAAAVVRPAPISFVDVGINLLDGMFKGVYHGKRCHPSDFAQVMERARKFHVSQMIITAGMQEECVEAAELARELGAFCTMGTHPTRCNEFLKLAPTPEEYLNRLRQLIVKNRDVVVAVGECGLDYDRLHFCGKDTQLRFFPPQILLAAELKLPLFLHDRNTGDDFFRICEQYKNEIAAAGGGVVHSFTGTADHLQRIQEAGFYVSVNGCSFKEDWQLDVARKIALDRLLIETDGPWCEIKPTHASHSLLQSAPQLVADVKRALALPDEPVARKVERFEPGCPVKSRCEPWEVSRVFAVMYVLRHDEVAGPAHLAQMIMANTRRLFGDKVGKPMVPRATDSLGAAAAAAVAQ